MTGGSPRFPHDKTATERRKGLTDKEIEQLELAGGVEGGMRAGSGGPDKKDRVRGEPRKSDDRRG